MVRWTFSTLAISPQLFPASRIVFNRCSSAGVQGVFVRARFGAGITELPWMGGGAGSFASPAFGDGSDASG